MKPEILRSGINHVIRGLAWVGHDLIVPTIRNAQREVISPLWSEVLKPRGKKAFQAAERQSKQPVTLTRRRLIAELLGAGAVGAAAAQLNERYNFFPYRIDITITRK